MSFKVVIPARYASTRLPAKALADIGGKPMIQWVYEQAKKSNASEVLVATDDQRIADAVVGFSGEVCMTSETHVSGTDRIQEASQLMGWAADELIVNVQGDEPLIPVSLINQVAANLLNNTDFQMATLCEPINNPEDFFNPNVVKVVFAKTGRALYFSRAPIPWSEDIVAGNAEKSARLFQAGNVQHAYRHIGIYAYKKSFLDDFISLPAVSVELEEKLEQLRAMWYGYDLHVAIAVDASPVGVDTPEDLENIISIVTATNFT